MLSESLSPLLPSSISQALAYSLPPFQFVSEGQSVHTQSAVSDGSTSCNRQLVSTENVGKGSRLLDWSYPKMHRDYEPGGKKKKRKEGRKAAVFRARRTPGRRRLRDKEERKKMITTSTSTPSTTITSRWNLLDGVYVHTHTHTHHTHTHTHTHLC